MFILTVHLPLTGVVASKSFIDGLAADRGFEAALVHFGPAYYYRLTSGGSVIREA